MPIKLPADLPAYDVLSREGVMVMAEERAARQDIRPLQIGLLNLMPKKAETETQFARVIGATPLQIELTLIRMSEHETRNTSAEHMEAFYHRFQDIKDRRFDGLIITGAPIEHLEFGQVTYIDELHEIFDWTQTHVHHTMGVCWGGMAMLNHFHGIHKDTLPKKAFGCFRHRNLAPASPYLRGFSDDFVVPVSRWTEMRLSDIEAEPELQILMASDEVGVCLVDDPCHRALYMLNHLEYDSTTLKAEYDRDVASGDTIQLPVNYFPGDDPTRRPENRWRSHAHLFYGNWINEIYQTTPFDLGEIGQA
ncbi:homoserine O-succinyltransferase [Halovulum dunhuangense]|uniref:Homoserine O-acetyltransferase n=1 Tax=Halovulum dunhuangense TaxID=1505036 RepID=A0A849L2V2_9RHOB|nr:homoserine O-succinyltransferase [Halovulum dunhuangense]NNU80521.1 homoserine O-succinyltransferase [Halovulum dunhuangense]